jgi:hypothetical protein
MRGLTAVKLQRCMLQDSALQNRKTCVRMTKLQTTTTRSLSLHAEFWKGWELTVLTKPYLMHMDKFYMNVVIPHYDMRRENMGLIMSMNFYHLPNTTFYQSEDRNASLHKGTWPVPVMHLCCWAYNTFLALFGKNSPQNLSEIVGSLWWNEPRDTWQQWRNQVP